MTFWNAQLFIWLAFYILFTSIDLFIGYSYTLIIYPLLYWALYCTAAKRLHDRNKTSWLLALTIIPILGPLWLFIQLLSLSKLVAHQSRILILDSERNYENLFYQKVVFQLLLFLGNFTLF